MRNNILFLCTGNSCRSQMAEGFLRKYAGDRFEVFSAGLDPRPVHPLAVKVMDEIGIDISGQQSKGVDTVLGKQSFKHAIFVCEQAEENCPSIYPFALEKLSWPFEDPAVFEGNEDEVVDKFRQVRDQIDRKIQAWLKSVATGDEKA
jgi:arsenate reductase (thioredoxin)